MVVSYHVAVNCINPPPPPWLLIPQPFPLKNMWTHSKIPHPADGPFVQAVF